MQQNVKRILRKLTIDICHTFAQSNPDFHYEPSFRPLRVLTKPSHGVKNDGEDNEHGDYILYVNCILGEGEHRYVVLDILGSGTFGQVTKCRNLVTGEIVAVKVVKNKPAYYRQGLIEVDILRELNTIYDPLDKHHILRLQHSFVHKHHLCLIFELLSFNLYELMRQNSFRGLSVNFIRILASQLLEALVVLRKAQIIHCDLKPENILLESLTSPKVKVIDFGSSCFVHKQMYAYIQSRFYRSPEVLLGVPYTTAIDMWSFGCIIAELYLGLPIFPGSSEYNQLSRIIETLGLPPNYMIEEGSNGSLYFNAMFNEHSPSTSMQYCFKSKQQFLEETQKMEKPSKRYFHSTNLPDLIFKYPMRKHMSSLERERVEMGHRALLLDFLNYVLQIDPLLRPTPEEAQNHPFISQLHTSIHTPPSSHASVHSGDDLLNVRRPNSDPVFHTKMFDEKTPMRDIQWTPPQSPEPHDTSTGCSTAVSYGADRSVTLKHLPLRHEQQRE
ncbi:kinase-like domain-containing protein [Radiomyces spectabilis]|uniref:kinase-like domain-containing protein n=1 Tax=Radiomyces spectabilis TaxID=64574 RepID=UPI00221F5532|nr:kinase-like domain-containing protein [Radiomyces spectabilis]KAI8367511.1 kinase-like domain-containing protein [Radiomyces spectabilis]